MVDSVEAHLNFEASGTNSLVCTYVCTYMCHNIDVRESFMQNSTKLLSDDTKIQK